MMNVELIKMRTPGQVADQDTGEGGPEAGSIL